MSVRFSRVLIAGLAMLPWTSSCVDDVGAPDDDVAGDTDAMDSQGTEGTDGASTIDPDTLSDCPKVYIDPLPPGDFRLVMHLFGTPIGDVHGGTIDVATFQHYDPDTVNCYELDPSWPNPNADVQYRYYMEIYLFDEDLHDTPDGYMLHDCTPWDSCPASHYSLTEDYYLPVAG